MVTSLITGGAGFIGSHLAEELVRLGRKVVIVDDLTNGRMGNLASVEHQIAFRLHDITRGLLSLEELEGVGEIYNLSCYPRQISFANPVRDCEVNLTGTISCLELARKTGAKVLFTSNTGIVSNPQSLPVDETFVPNPLTPYDIHKLASEYMLKAYHKYHRIRAVTVRFASIYGPRQRVNDKLGWKPVIPEFVTKFLRGGVPTIDGDGRQTRDFLYVKDAVRGVVQAMESKAAEANNGGMFILGTCVETSINDICSAIVRLLNSEAKAEHGPAKLEDIMRMRYDYTKAKTTFGFDPKTPLEDGLRETVEFLRKEARSQISGP
jgi:UDP-glucose 4-epimerase